MHTRDNDKYVKRKVCDCVAIFFDFKFRLYVTHLKHSFARYHVEVDETVHTSNQRERSKV